MKRFFISYIIFTAAFSVLAGQQAAQDMKREVTLYNPYKPSLQNATKKSYLPPLTDTAGIKPEFDYNIESKPFFPVYQISPIKSANMQPEALNKLYKSYVNLGLGNYLTPLAEVSISNERSKKGAFGFYAGHFSSNGKVKLQNEEKVFAGYMDNDVSFYGRKFFSRNILEGSAGFAQRIRHAYGYDTTMVNYDPEKKDVRMGYNNLEAAMKLGSITLDSSDLAYDLNLKYNFFYNTPELYQHKASVTANATKTIKGFYAGSGLDANFYFPVEGIMQGVKYNAALNAFVTKSTAQWNFRIGLKAMAERNPMAKTLMHVYPDVRFGFSIVPSYVAFYTALSGYLDDNDPIRIIDTNPFIVQDGSLFTLPSTDNELIVSAGLKGNNGMGGNYLIEASYSVIDDMLFYSNYYFPDTVFSFEAGNHFVPFNDDVEILKIHGEISGKISNRLSYRGSGNWYNYNLAVSDFAWNKPDWDASVDFRYNLRDKIIAGAGLEAMGERKLLASRYYDLSSSADMIFTNPAHINMNISAEYRYSKILSFWLKLGNISFNRYYEWAYYPSQRFIGLVGFTYSL